MPTVTEHSECTDCPMLFRDTDGEDKCSLGFAGPLDDCTRAGIAHLLSDENADLQRQVVGMAKALKACESIELKSVHELFYDEPLRCALCGNPSWKGHLEGCQIEQALSAAPRMIWDGVAVTRHNHPFGGGWYTSFLLYGYHGHIILMDRPGEVGEIVLLGRRALKAGEHVGVFVMEKKGREASCAERNTL